FSNGCFDILHFGHIKYLEKAKRLGDILIIGLNSDVSVKRLKGENRPINSEFQRACMLASLYFVDYVVIFDEDTPLKLIEFLKPDILVKGADYKDKEVVGSNLVKKVELIEFEEGFSTTNIIKRIKNDRKD
ncbi:D-glycero-beta-D-manno-heptose 1-phosphate adenylyltransferase, partial [Campylobacter volucris]